MKRKYDFISASLFFENTIKIPYKRLRTMLHKGDVIRGHCHKFSISANYVEYEVTHVDHWGVYAVPTANMFANVTKNRPPEYIQKCKGHIKFKWENIFGIIFKESIEE